MPNSVCTAGSTTIAAYMPPPPTVISTTVVSRRSQACRESSRWAAMGLSDLTIAINLSVRQFRDAEFATRIGKIFEAAQQRPLYIVQDKVDGRIVTLGVREHKGAIVEAVRRLSDAGLDVDDLERVGRDCGGDGVTQLGG